MQDDGSLRRPAVDGVQQARQAITQVNPNPPDNLFAPFEDKVSYEWACFAIRAGLSEEAAKDMFAMLQKTVSTPCCKSQTL